MKSQLRYESAKNKLQSRRNTRYINYTFVYRSRNSESLQISDVAYINIFKAEQIEGVASFASNRSQIAAKFSTRFVCASGRNGPGRDSDVGGN